MLEICFFDLALTGMALRPLNPLRLVVCGCNIHHFSKMRDVNVSLEEEELHNRELSLYPRRTHDRSKKLDHLRERYRNAFRSSNSH